MKASLSTLAGVVVAFLAGAAQAVTVTTTVDTNARSIVLDFTELPPYEQIRLEGVNALYWCNCVDLDNPSSLLGTGFTVNGDNLEMQYEGAPPPSTNFIDYHYLDGYVLAGFESIDWILVTESAGGELRVTGNRPILVLVPEPSTGLLYFVGLSILSVLRSSSPTVPPSLPSVPG